MKFVNFLKNTLIFHVLSLEYLQKVHRFILSVVVDIQIPIKGAVLLSNLQMTNFNGIAMIFLFKVTL